MTIEQTPPHTPAAPPADGGAAPVIGWSSSDQRWVTGTGTRHDVHDIPALDGTLELPRSDESFGDDFGRLVQQPPQAILRTGSGADVAKVVGFARDRGLKVAMNGQGGQDGQRESHSLYGQALVGTGIAIDSKSLGTIHHIGDGLADVDAGVRWSSLVTAAVETGQAPPVVNDFPYLSVGGTLSIGGLGPTSHRYGSQADNVTELQVVTGHGDLVTCSRTQHPELFDAVLAGAGQYGLIVGAVVKLVPAESSVRMMKVVYGDRDTYLSDAIRVMQGGLVDDLAGAVIPHDGGWAYGLIMAMYHTPPASPPERAVLERMSAGATVVEQQEMSYLDWMFRLDTLWEQLKDEGYWSQAKPRFTVFVAADRASELAEAVLADLSVDDLGAGGVRLSPVNTSAMTQPMFMLPSRTVPAFELSLGRFPPPDHPDIAGLLTQNRRFYDRAVACGAKRYLYGAIPDMTTEDWQRHYGDLWPTITALKTRFDPAHVLTPGQHIFG